MKFVFFSVSENGGNGLGGEGADGGNAPPIFGLEPPPLGPTFPLRLHQWLVTLCVSCIVRSHVQQTSRCFTPDAQLPTV